jgi:hypothetical protein
MNHNHRASEGGQPWAPLTAYTATPVRQWVVESGQPYLLQPHAGARIDTTLANPGRMAATEAMAPAPASTVLQQPCKGIVCNFDAACADHHCPGHPFNTATSDESTDPTDFAGLDAARTRRGGTSVMWWIKAAAVAVVVGIASLFMGHPTEH